MSLTEQEQAAIRELVDTHQAARSDATQARRSTAVQSLLKLTGASVLVSAVLGLLFVWIFLPSLINKVTGSLVDSQTSLKLTEQEVRDQYEQLKRQASKIKDQLEQESQRSNLAHESLAKEYAALKKQVEGWQDAFRRITDDEDLLNAYKDSLQEFTQLDEGARSTLARLVSLERSVFDLLPIRQFAAQDRSHSYWPTPGGKPSKDALVPLNRELSVTLETKAIAVLTATGTTRRMSTGGEIHLGFLNAEGEPFGSTYHYRGVGGNHADIGAGWAPFAVTNIIELTPGTHAFGFGHIRETDTKWQLHATRIEAIIIPIPERQTLTESPP